MPNGQEEKKPLTFQVGTIVAREMIAQNMLLLRAGGEEYRHQAGQPGSHIGIFWKDRGKEHRHYTLWDYDAEAGTFDLLILLHDEKPGPGLIWAKEAQVGDEFLFRGPRSTYKIDGEAPYYLFAAEETGAVAVQGFLRILPAHMQVFGLLEANQSQGEIPAPVSEKKLSWVHRQGHPVSANGPLVTSIRSLDLPAEPGKAYFAGESEQCLAIRSYLINERNWPRENIHVQPFWTRGKSHEDE